MSRNDGGVIYIFEFKQASVPDVEPDDTYLEHIMDAIESFFADLIVKALHKTAPTLSADDDVKVRKAVGDFVATGLDLAAVYLALRNAKK